MELDVNGIFFDSADAGDHESILVMRAAWDRYTGHDKRRAAVKESKVRARYDAGMPQLPGQEKLSPRLPIQNRLLPSFMRGTDDQGVIALNADELPAMIYALKTARRTNKATKTFTYGNPEAVAESLMAVYRENFAPKPEPGQEAVS